VENFFEKLTSGGGAFIWHLSVSVPHVKFGQSISLSNLYDVNLGTNVFDLNDIIKRLSKYTSWKDEIQQWSLNEMLGKVVKFLSRGKIKEVKGDFGEGDFNISF